MAWTLQEARQAAGQIRSSQRGRQVLDTIRPRSATGVVRSRAPLPLVLYLASHDTYLVEARTGGFAVIQPPMIARPPTRDQIHWALLRRVDRYWEFLIFFGPPVLAMVAAAAIGVIHPAGVDAALVLILVALAWIALLLTVFVVYHVGSLAGLFGPTRTMGGRAAQSVRGDHWTIPVLHSPDASGVEDLLERVRTRITAVAQRDAEWAPGVQATFQARFTGNPVVLTTGVTTDEARRAAKASISAIKEYGHSDDLVLLESPARARGRAAQRPALGGGFALLFIAGVATVLAVEALIVSGAEADACRSACSAHPTSYGSALSYLLQRLFFTDPSGITPLTLRTTVLGWLTSCLTICGVLVLAVAFRAEVHRNKAVVDEKNASQVVIADRSRALLLVVTSGEMDAVLNAAYAVTGQHAVSDQTTDRTVERAGIVNNTEVLVAQAGDQGNVSNAGMLVMANKLVGHYQPDLIVLVGICYGLLEDEGQRLGDIVVARRIRALDHRKITRSRVIDKGIVVSPTPVLIDRFQTAQRSWSRNGGATVHFGEVLTFNAVVNSLPFVRKLRNRYPGAIAGEMEASAAYEAAAEGEKPDWIMVKAICDWGHGKTDTHQAIAARNAAEFVIHTLNTSDIRTRR